MNWKTKTDQSAIVAAALQQHFTQRFEQEHYNPLENIMRKTRPKKIEARSVIDTGLSRRKRPVQKEERREYVIDNGPKPQFTLAQKLGLLDPPTASSLTETGWISVKSKCVARGDPGQPCPICQEDFGLTQTVLLSCSHVFHKTCLDAFERFSGRKTCPLCRHQEYQKRIIYDGEKHYLSKCATRIQTAWRAYRVRRWYYEYRRRNPPKDPTLRQRWCEARLGEVTDKLLARLDLDVDDFLGELDRDVANSRLVFDSWDRRPLTNTQWEEVCERHGRRHDKECPICLTEWSTSRRRVILSCSHVFHAVCLATLEQLSVDTVTKTCPVCRSPYCKKEIE